VPTLVQADRHEGRESLLLPLRVLRLPRLRRPPADMRGRDGPVGSRPEDEVVAVSA
jgi:hypothetical protein